MKDFPKTIYVQQAFIGGMFWYFHGWKDKNDTYKNKEYAVYELKEVKKKVTNVELIDL